MIWSKCVALSAASARAAGAVTRPARPRMSATMISLPIPFIRAKGMRWLMRCYMAETAGDYQCRERRRLERFLNHGRWILQMIALFWRLKGLDTACGRPAPTEGLE